MCHSYSVIQYFVTVRDWLAHSLINIAKVILRELPQWREAIRGWSWNAALDTRVWQDYRVSRTVICREGNFREERASASDLISKSVGLN